MSLECIFHDDEVSNTKKIANVSFRVKLFIRSKDYGWKFSKRNEEPTASRSMKHEAWEWSMKRIVVCKMRIKHQDNQKYANNVAKECFKEIRWNYKNGIEAILSTLKIYWSIDPGKCTDYLNLPKCVEKKRKKEKTLSIA